MYYYRGLIFSSLFFFFFFLKHARFEVADSVDRKVNSRLSISSQVKALSTSPLLVASLYILRVLRL